MLSLPAPRMILRPDLCEAVIDFVATHAGQLPRHQLYAGALVRRTVSREKLSAPQSGSIVYSRPGGDRNRMDGTTPRGDTRPALYLSLDDHATLAENLHYSLHKSRVPVIQFKQLEEKASLWLPEKTVLTLRVQRMLVVADVRRDNAEGMRFLREMNADRAVKEALHRAGLGHVLQGLYNETDYSISRGVAFAIDQSLGLPGLLFNTARISQHGERFADNLALFGDHAQAHPGLLVVAAEEFHRDPRTGQLVPLLTYLHPSIPRDNFPGFKV